MSVTKIYPTIYDKIQSVLNSVNRIKELHNHPTPNITKYPAAIYYPETVQNSFETTQENLKEYIFKVYVIIGATTQKDIETIMRYTMPDTVDQLLEEIDKQWDFDTIDGHTTWAKVETGSWTVSEETNSIEIVSEFDLSVKVLTSN